MFKRCNIENGSPPKIYRSIGEIRSDISRIKERILEANNMLNIRSVLIDVLAGEREDAPERLMPELEEAISEAREALNRLSELEEELYALEEELGDAKFIFGF